MAGFWEMVLTAHREKSSSLVVGLDPDFGKLPGQFISPDGVVEFFGKIVDATVPFVCGYKPNLAFFLAMGERGIEVLRRVIEAIKSRSEPIPVILDGKFNDVRHTAEKYADFARYLGVDAVVVNPYPGRDTVEPFLQRGLGVIVLGVTSNPTYEDLQALDVDGEPLYVAVARRVAQWSEQAGERIGLVVGATHPDTFVKIRAAAPQSPFLVPGIGAQGGEPGKSLQAATTDDGFPPMVVSARSIIYASSGEDFAERAAEAAKLTRDKINNWLAKN